MGKYQDLTNHIPWHSLGRDTVAARVGNSIVPVGVLPYETRGPMDQLDSTNTFSINDSFYEEYLMNIIGTAIQGGKGKLVTCGHVVEALVKNKNQGYILATIRKGNLIAFVPYRIDYSHAIGYVDPRTDSINPNVDLAVLIIPAKSTPNVPYEMSPVRWGDSTKLGVGDQVAVGGFPLGKDMFLLNKTNRGIIQPTFYSGIVSSILPATKPGEIRIIQVSIPVAGGMSGGAVFDPLTGEVLGMVTSGLDIQKIPQPITYAIPSEIIAPFLEVITYKDKDSP